MEKEKEVIPPRLRVEVQELENGFLVDLDENCDDWDKKSKKYFFSSFREVAVFLDESCTHKTGKAA